MFKNIFFSEPFQMSASEYRNNMLRAFKTKGEKSESNDFLVTYFYILMASTYMWLIYNTSIYEAASACANNGWHVNPYQVTKQRS